MTPSKEEAQRFLTALTGRENAPVTFQTFPDAKLERMPRSGDPRIVILHGTLDRQWDVLQDLNESGAGIFIMVNEGDLFGRTAKNVTALRSLFIDDDNGSLNRELLKVLPSIVVRSKRGPHVYWRLKHGEELASFRPAQEVLIEHFGTDPQVKDLPRVLRLPGFNHVKNPADPFLVQVEEVNDVKYTIEEVLTGLGLDTETFNERKRYRSGKLLDAPQYDSFFEKSEADETSALLTLTAMMKHPLVRWMEQDPNFVSREVWRGVATNFAAIVLDFPSLKPLALNLFHQISKPYICYSSIETTNTFNGALESAKTFGPITFEHMIANEAPEDVCQGGTCLIHAARMMD